MDNDVDYCTGGNSKYIICNTVEFYGYPPPNKPNLSF